MYILDRSRNELIKAVIEKASKDDLANTESQWKFNWSQAFKTTNTEIYVIKTMDSEQAIQGMLQLRIVDGMLIMDLIEIAPSNIGSKQKSYNYVAGCLIAFACKESFKLTSSYKGFLTFNSKTELIDLYKSKYRAKQVVGQRMYIDPENGIQLIEEYLHRTR